MAAIGDKGSPLSWQMTHLQHGPSAAKIHLIKKSAEAEFRHQVTLSLKAAGLKSRKTFEVIEKVERYYADKVARKNALKTDPSPFAKPDYKHKLHKAEAVTKFLQGKVIAHKQLAKNFQFLVQSLPKTLIGTFAKKLVDLEIAHEIKASKWAKRLADATRNPQQFTMPKKQQVNDLPKTTLDPNCSRRITIAVVESGLFDSAHPDLKNKALTRVVRDAAAMVKDHATHVAGIILNTYPRAKISNYTIAEIQAGEALSLSETVVNLSCNILNSALVVFKHLVGKDRVLVKSMGNEGRFVTNDPLKLLFLDDALLNKTLLVVNVQNDGITPSSNSNLPGKRLSEMTVCAPGVGIRSTISNGKQGIMSGTSMAAPVVSAIVGAVREKHPFLSAEEAAIAVKRGAQPIILNEDGAYQMLSSRTELEGFSQTTVDRSMEIWGWGLANFKGALKSAHKLAILKAQVLLKSRRDILMSEWEKLKVDSGLTVDELRQAAPNLMTVTCLSEPSLHVGLTVLQKAK